VAGFNSSLFYFPILQQRSDLVFTKILKRDGTKEILQPKKIADAIFKAVRAVGGED
jgi:hypothetical protein